MGAIWRTEWIRPYESAWSIFEKFSYANVINRNTILKAFGNAEVKSIKNMHVGNHFRDLLTLKGFDEKLLEKYLNVNLHTHTNHVINQLLRPLGPNLGNSQNWFAPHLCWCPSCLNHGYHSMLHQFTLFKNCPVHNVKLVEECPSCNVKIPFLLSDAVMDKAFTCKCGHKYSDLHWNQWNLNLTINDQNIKGWINKTERDINTDPIIYIPSNIDFGVLNTLNKKEFVAEFKISNMKKNEKIMDESILFEEIFIENRIIYKALDQQIRKSLNLHKLCIRRLQLLLKEERADFPPICPAAYSYIFWRQSILGSPYFYGHLKGLNQKGREKNDFNVISPLYREELKQLYTVTKATLARENITDTKPLKWIINKASAYLYSQLFLHWVNLAEEGSSNIRVPRGEALIKTLKEEMNFGFVIKRDSQKQITIHFSQGKNYQIKHTQNRKIKNECNQFNKREIRMRSYIPIAVSMMSFENQEAKKREQVYVDQYVAKLNL